MLYNPNVAASTNTVRIISNLLRLSIPLVLSTSTLGYLTGVTVSNVSDGPRVCHHRRPLIVAPRCHRLSHLITNSRIGSLNATVTTTRGII